MSYSDEELKKIFAETKTIAVIGCSSNPSKPSHKIPTFLKEKGYRIIPVNPNSERILGEKTYNSITDVKEKVDLVQVFRPSEETPGIVKQAVKINPEVIWLQLGIRNEKAKRIAEKHGVKIVMDKCMMVEYDRLIF